MPGQRQSASGSFRGALTAGALSLLTPGLGHLYAGRGWRAVGVVALSMLGILLMALGLVAGSHLRGVTIALTMSAIVFSVAVTLDAGVCGYGRQPPAGSRRVHAGRYVLFALLSIGAIQLEQAGVREFWVEPVRVPSESMAPTILSGDYVMVAKRAFARVAPRAGDVVMVSSPIDSSQRFVKRVVAGPGDVVELADGRILVNGAELPGPRSRVPFARTSLGPDSYFVLGDNRDNSQDSRLWGAVDVGAIEGRVLLIYFSADPDFNHIRWTRLGRNVE